MTAFSGQKRTELAQLGIIGCGVMGGNLALNFVDHGISVQVYDENPSSMEHYAKLNKSDTYLGFSDNIEDFVTELSSPRSILLMIPAGKPVESALSKLYTLLSPGDILIDGGNTHPDESVKRALEIENRGFLYIGTGISGGSEGARNGPAIMPGGSEVAWKTVGPMFQAISAKSKDGNPCCNWMGSGGAGHYVKTIHNGIEYAIMQLIAETYLIMHEVYKQDHDGISKFFDKCSSGINDSFLVGITSQILKNHETSGIPAIDSLRDETHQKGTGGWTIELGLSHTIPCGILAEGVFSRNLSCLNRNTETVKNSSEDALYNFNETIAEKIESALYLATLLSFDQGLMILSAEKTKNHWPINLGQITETWRAGCILHGRPVETITEELVKRPLANSLFDTGIKALIQEYVEDLREFVVAAMEAKTPIPCFSAALAYVVGYSAPNLGANLVQAQRDCFGAHSYRRIDQPDNKRFHRDWLGNGEEKLLP